MRNKREIEPKQKPTNNNKQQRLDEPEQGAFVFAHKIDIFDKYLVGTPRRPFQQPRKYFILLVSNYKKIWFFVCIVSFISFNFQVTQVEEGWRKTGEKVLERLWKSYGIIHAMLIAPCARTGESVKCHCSMDP